MLVIVELLLAGGMFMFGILATSLVAVGIIAQRVFTLWMGFRINVETLRDKVLAHVDDGDYGKAAQLCDGKHPLQRMMLAAIERAIDEQEAKGKQTRSSSLDLRTKAQKLLDLWKYAQAEYAGQTGDFDSGIWLE